MERSGHSEWHAQTDDSCSGRQQRRRKYTVVGTDEESSVARHGDGGTRRADAGIDDHEMDRTVGKTSPDARDGEACTFDVLRRDIMRDVDKLGVGHAR